MNPNLQTRPSNDSSDDYMFKKVMKGDWAAVVEAYRGLDEAGQKKHITKSGDTVLHVAINRGKEEYVRLLLGHARSVEVLNTINRRGNTPLHLASTLGHLGMCQYIFDKSDELLVQEPGLIAVRNKEGESPLFLAALHGHRDVFFYLASHAFKDKAGAPLCTISDGDTVPTCSIVHVDPVDFNNRTMPSLRRNDGDTILHCSIAAEFFDLAFWIIRTLPSLTNTVNEKGLSPLQILPNHPSAFPSGNRLKGIASLVYACTWVDRLDFASLERYLEKKQIRTSHSNVPENYKTCFSIMDALKNIADTCYFNLKLEKSETPQPHNGDVEESGKRKGANRGDIEKNYYPENYTSLVDIIKILVRIPLIPLGLEFGKLQRIRMLKEKHIWAVQVMEELINNASSYQYYDNTAGKKPTDFDLAGHSFKAPSIDEEMPSPSGLPSEEEISSAGDANEEAQYKPQNFIKRRWTPQTGLEDEIKFLVTAKNGVIKSVERYMNEGNGKPTEGTKETALLTAARLGIVEMVKGILETFPVASEDKDQEDKNVVLLAVENRQPRVYQYLLRSNSMMESVFREVDKKGNSALHLAATLGQTQPWLIPGAALQMQWEIKWFKYIESTMPINFFRGFNAEGKTPKEVFSDTHKELVSEGGKWLTKTSQSCSVVAALIATVAFATATTVPGGIDEKTGFPVLEREPPFKAFAISSLVALCFSVTSLVMFLSILTSRYEEKDFNRGLPFKLILGLSSLYVSLTAMLVSFCAGHFYVLREKIKYAAYPIYTLTCLPITFFALAQFPLYVDLIRCTLRKVPLRTYKMLSI